MKVRRTRVRNGVREQQCTACEQWKPLGEFHRNKLGHFGRTAMCKLCRRHRRRQNNLKPSYRTKRLERSRRIAEADRVADVINGRYVGHESRIVQRTVPGSLVRGWLEQAIAALPDDAPKETLSLAAGVPERSMRRIESGEFENVSFDLAEKIAKALGHDEELYDMFLETGVDEWGPNGVRYCQECGTWWRKHHAGGYCGRCYHRLYKARRQGRVPSLPPDAWNRRYAYCRVCRRTDARHWAYGVCNGCKDAVSKAARSCGLTPREFMERELYHAVARRRMATPRKKFTNRAVPKRR